MRALARIAVFLVSLAFALVLAEQILKWSDYEYRPVSIDAATTDDERLYHLFGSDLFAYDPDLIWRPKPNRDVFNAEGFRGPVMGTERPAGRVRIVAVGDSNTLGWAGPTGPNWPQSLADLLAQRGIAADVVNAGVWGYSSLQGLGRLREVLEYGPHIVLISFGSNDGLQVAIPDRRFAGKSERWREFERWFNSFRSGQLITAVANRARRGGDRLGPRVDLGEYRQNLATMAELASSAGARIVYLTRPYEFEIPDDRRWKNFGPDYNLATAEIARDVDAPLVDFYSYFKGRRQYFADESHFTAAGHLLAATILIEEIGDLIVEEAVAEGAVVARRRKRPSRGRDAGDGQLRVGRAADASGP